MSSKAKSATGKSKAKTTPVAPKSKLKGKTRSVVYPILLECAERVKDPFWKQFYEDLAMAKATKGIYISNGVIHTSSKRGGFSYSVSEKAPEVIVAELHSLLTTHTSIHSRKDIIKKRQLIDELEAELEEYDQGKWTAIKRKSIRMVLLARYALKLRQEHDLDWSGTMGAYRTIIGAFEGKTHTSKDVEYEDGEVINIADIEWDGDSDAIINLRDKERVTDEDPDESWSQPDETPSSNAIYLQSLWEPYIGAYIKMAS